MQVIDCEVFIPSNAEKVLFFIFMCSGIWKLAPIFPSLYYHSSYDILAFSVQRIRLANNYYNFIHFDGQ